MQKNKDDELLKATLKKKLDWYTLYAAEEEYNEEDVEHILSLLDSLEPLEEGEVPPVEEAWGRFCQMRENSRELLPLEREVPLSLGGGEAADDKKTSGSRERSSIPNKDKGKIIKFVLGHKTIVAAIFLVMVLAVGGSIQACAIKNRGFFMWLKHDETGADIFTSPGTLVVETDTMKTSNYTDRNDMPEWSKNWLKIEAEFELPSNYEWQCFQIKEIDYVRNIMSCYLDKDSNRDMMLGIYIYTEGVYYNREGFANYDWFDSYEIDYGQLDVYYNTEETGKLTYVICFYEGNCKYFILMQGDLDEVKKLTEQYWSYVKKYL